MSGVHATQTPAEDTPELEAYLDTLYEIVATGVEPPEGVSLERIEAFLHEHAREAKSCSDFVDFFRQTGLRPRAAGEARAPLRVLDPLPPVEPPPAAFAEPGLLDMEGANAPDETTRPAIALPTRYGRLSPVVVAAATVLLLGFGASMTWGYLTLSRLRTDLARAQAQTADNRIAIEQLDHRASQISRDVGETGAAMRRFERKNDILMDALLPAPVDRP